MMKTILFTLLLSLTSLASAQTDSELNGKWMINTVTQEGRDVSIKHNPRNERFIIFNNDGTFESGGYPYGKNTGKYEIKSDGTLFLDSDAGPEDDSSWNYTIEAETMTWTGVGSEWAEQFVLTYIKTN